MKRVYLEILDKNRIMFMYVKVMILSGNCLVIVFLCKCCIINSLLLLFINVWFKYCLIKV